IAAAMLAVVVPITGAALAPDVQALIAWRFLQGLLLPPIFAVTVAYIGDEWAAGAGGGRRPHLSPDPVSADFPAASFRACSAISSAGAAPSLPLAACPLRGAVPPPGWRARGKGFVRLQGSP